MWIRFQVVQFFRGTSLGKWFVLDSVELSLDVQLSHRVDNLLSVLVLTRLSMWDMRHEIADVFESVIAHCTDDINSFITAIPSGEEIFARFIAGSKEITTERQEEVSKINRRKTRRKT